MASKHPIVQIDAGMVKQQSVVLPLHYCYTQLVTLVILGWKEIAHEE